MKRHILLFSMLLIPGLLSAHNLPGSFPNTAVFKGKYVKHFQNSDMVGSWTIIANDRINKLNIKSAGSSLIITSRSKKETFKVNKWVPFTGLLEFTRTLDKSPKPNTVQKFTGYLMEYPDITWAKKSGKQNTKDYKWRMAGIYTTSSDKPLNKPSSGWYATRPRK